MKLPKILSIFIGLALSIVALESVHAAVFSCPAADVECLIDAINTSNTNGENDTINLEAGIYTLTSVNNDTRGYNGLPSITSAITINGAEASLTKIKRDDSAPRFRIFYISPGGDLTIRDTTISGGHIWINSYPQYGGGFFNEGNLRITDCIISDNQAWHIGGGISNGRDGILEVTYTELTGNSTQSSNGGGIFNQGISTITNSIVNNNMGADIGGGLINYPGGTVIMINSTISENTPDGITNWGECSLEVVASSISGNNGTGLKNYEGTVSITNSTISSNIGGGIFDRGEMNLTNCTVSGNIGSGISSGFEGSSNPSLVNITNTIVAGNTADNSSISDCRIAPAGNIESLGYNLVGINTGCPNDGPGDQTVVPAEVYETVLGPLQNNGGPTETHDLLPGSPAIDAGDDLSCPVNDQRGIERPLDGDGDGIAQCDIGAVEFQTTLVIDGCETSVQDQVYEGKSISEWIEECGENAKNHGKFVSCIAHLTNDLKWTGIINGEEKDKIQSCAAQADIP